MVRYDVDEGIATITLDRPAKRNAVTPEMGRELARLAREANGDPQVRAVVLTGAGDVAFCAGSDVASLPPDATFWEVRNRDLDYTYALRTIRKPLLAMIRGYALGGGLELALMCDIRYADETASFGAPEVRLGWTPGGGASQLLPRLVGYGHALELMLTGRRVDAARALEIGLVERVLPAGELEDAVYGLAREIAELSPIAVEAVKQAVRISLSTPPEVGMQAENELFALCFASEDHREGIRAFLEKRRPEFHGR